MSTESNLENLQSQLVTAIEAVKQGTSDDYRSTVARVERIYYDIDSFSSFPAVMVLFSDETLSSIDSGRDLWNGRTKVVLLVYTRRSGMEDVVADLKRVLANISKSQINSPTNRWVFSTEDSRTPGIHITRNYLSEVDLCIVSLDVTVVLKGQKQPF